MTEKDKNVSLVCQSYTSICNTCSDDMIDMAAHGNRELMAHKYGVCELPTRRLVSSCAAVCREMAAATA